MIRENSFGKVKRDFVKELAGTFSAIINSDDSIKGYPEHILNVFIRFNSKSSYDLDFELDKDDFIRFDLLKFSKEEWMLIYGLFKEVFKFNHKLNPFIYLFFYDLIYYSSFGEDIEALDMSDELLGLMGSEMLKLYTLFDEYFNSDDSNLVNDIVDASKADTIPAFVVIHLASWINEHVGNDKRELGDPICELYTIALGKIYKKPELTQDDYLEISSMFFEIDTSNFSDIQTDRVYSTVGKFEINNKRNSMKKRIANPRFRC